MNAPTKLAAFGLALGLAFAGGAALGEVVGPVDVGGSDGHPAETHPSESHPSDTRPNEPAPTTTVGHEGGH
jgi:hypothetical protein